MIITLLLARIGTRGLLRKSRIFHENVQTHKVPTADTSRYQTMMPGRGCRRATTARGDVVFQAKEGLPMKSPQLRIDHGPSENLGGVDLTETSVQRRNVTLPLMDVLPLIADAVRSERTWLGDFADDDITISMDLYEVLLAYQHYRRPSA
ncbi:MAG: hypothetical protein GX621_09785 [Pirellulaceae bacterium]|nr:hypothetical protein [Pirellulaceae bacterium]